MRIINILFKYTFIIYTIISIIVLLLIKLSRVSYGDGLTDSLMFIIFISTLFVIAFVYWIIQTRVNNNVVFFKILLILAHIFMIGYYFLEDNFYLK